MKTKFFSFVLFLSLGFAVCSHSQVDYILSLTELSDSNKKLDMIYVQGGTYKRGCSDGDSKCETQEKPAHNVTLNDYYIGKYELTNAQWKAVMGDNTAK